MTRTCAGCSKPVSRKAIRCRSCAAKRLNADVDICARRVARSREYHARPETKAALRQRIAAYMAEMPEADRQRRREHGHRMIATALHTNEAKAKAAAARSTPEVRERRGRTLTRTRLPWCPDELIPLYRELTRKGMLAAEARAALELQIPGTAAHAARTVANYIDAGRIRQERERAQAY